MDVLSEVLKTVRLEGALFYHAEFSAPWSFRSPSSSTVAPCFGCAARHVIIYHMLTEGRAWARLEGGPAVNLEAGDIVVFPHGDAHLMGNGPPVAPVDNGRELERIMAQGLRLARMGGGGEVSRYICGYMAGDPQVCRLFLSGLPPMFRVRVRDDPAGQWLEETIRFSVEQAGESRPGAEAFLAKLSEALFVETLRRYVAEMAPSDTGWLAGARDEQVGRALALLHGNPARPWTVPMLAHEAGVCRTVLTERFQRYLGESPMAYLIKWRLQLGAQRLAAGTRSVAEIAGEAGYASEAAFNRAFKREFGVPPAQYRRAAKAPARAASP